MENTFKPTWLYIKQHNQTGKKYFGKTVQDPFTYKGSGIVWTRHLKCHGNDVTTLWAELFTDREKLIEYATKFSLENKIVESQEWANLIIENGLIGGRIRSSYKWNEQQRINHIKMMKEKVRTKESNEKRSATLQGRTPWNKGIACTEAEKKIKSKATSSLIWVTNKEVGKTRRIKPVELESYELNGYIKGRS